MRAGDHAGTDRLGEPDAVDEVTDGGPHPRQVAVGQTEALAVGRKGQAADGVPGRSAQRGTRPVAEVAGIQQADGIRLAQCQQRLAWMKGQRLAHLR